MATNPPPDVPAHDAPISLDAEPTAEYMRGVVIEIAREKARTEKWLALILVGALVLSLPVYFVALYAMPEAATHLVDAMDKWFTVMGPLAGAALGVAYLRQGQSHDRSRTNG